MSADFNIAYNPVRTFEGDWCDVPGDKGGETYAGIARAFFPDWPGWHFIDAAKAHPSFQQGSLAFSRHLTTLPNLEDLVTAFYGSSGGTRWALPAGPSWWPTNCSNRPSI
ncbi:MAG: glycosyl hydrolase 108 family protein, partial [Bilophila wadsworthia]